MTLTKSAGMAVDVAKLGQLVGERAPEYFPDLRGVGSARLLGEWHPAYSSVYRFAVEAASGQREVVVKVFAGAAVQFQGMQTAWPRFAEHPTWRIPRPLDVLPDGPALVMEAVPGTSLHGCLPRLGWGRGAREAAAHHCRRAGEWLRFYHGEPGDGDTAMLDVAGKWRDLEQVLAELVGLGFDQRRCGRFAAALRPLVGRLAGRPLSAAHLHGEFTVDNVFLDGERMIGLDLWGEHRQAVQHDLGSFVNSLWLLRLSRPAPRSALTALSREFLRGYFGRDDYDTAAIVFLQGVGLADVAVEMCRRRRSGLARAWIARVLTDAFETVGTLSERIDR